MSSESNLWNWLSVPVGTVIPTAFDIQRIENSVGIGVPDVEGCIDGVQFWVELKSLKRPKRKSTKLRVKFRNGQVHWIVNRYYSGGISGVLLSVGEKNTIERYFLNGKNVLILEEPILEADLASFKVEKSSIDFLRNIHKRGKL